MAERVYDFPIQPYGHVGYPWEDWLQGIWRLRKGEDFDVDVHKFQKVAHHAARARGLKVKTHVEDESTILIEFQNDTTKYVFTMTESEVYHLYRDCPALNRINRYWPVTKIAATTTGQRRLCRLCAKRADQQEASPN